MSLGATFGRCRAWRAGVAGSRDSLHALLVSLAGAVVREPKRPPLYPVVVGDVRGPWETRKAGRSGGIVRIVDGTVDVLGAHITAGVTWLAPVSRGGGLVADHVDRLELGGGALSEERALSEFEESFEALLSRLQPGVVALLDMGTSGRPSKPTVVRSRGQMEGALMIACERGSCGLTRISHDQVQKAVGMRPTAQGFSRQLGKRLSSDPPVRWNERGPAYAAASVFLEVEDE